MTAKTPKTRISRKARLHQFPVLGLFRPVLAGKPGAPTGAGVRTFPVCFLELTERSQAPGCAGCPVLPCYLQEGRVAGRAIPACVNEIARHCTLARPISPRSHKCRIDGHFL